MDFRLLAPQELPSYRTLRYLGDDLCISLQSFTSADQGEILWLYSFLQRLFAATASGLHPHRSSVGALLEEVSVDELLTRTRSLGIASHQANPSQRLVEAVHDLRGGALTALLGHLQLFLLDPTIPLEPISFLTRDHLKIMRNVLVGLDDLKREDDLLPKMHSTDLIVEKWDGAIWNHDGREICLKVNCVRSTAIASCCVEFGALDRILYNLLNQCSRRSTDGTIELTILPIPEDSAHSLRFVVLNPATVTDPALRPGEADAMVSSARSKFSDDAATELAITAEFVSNAYGLAGPQAAFTEGYVGYRLLQDQSVSWFHWPIVPE
jgi:hypothetical protein